MVERSDDEEGSFQSIDPPLQPRHPPPAPAGHGGMQEKGGRGWKVMEKMEVANPDPDNLDNMRRTMRLCVTLGIAMCILVVLAVVMLWDNISLGPRVRGYEFTPHHARSYRGAASDAMSVAALRREGLKKAVASKKIREHNHVKSLVRSKAIGLAQKAAIEEVAKTYAPASWFAAHRHPEKAAIEHVVHSKRDFDRVQDVVEGKMLNSHYHGKYNPTALQIRSVVPQYSQRELNDLVEKDASVATVMAMKRLARQVGKSWIDHGLGERKELSKTGWIRDQVHEDIGGGRGSSSNGGHYGVHTSHPHHFASGQHHAGTGSEVSHHKGSLDLPGLGNVRSPEQAAKALAALAGKQSSATGSSARAQSSSHSTYRKLGLSQPHRTLHAALKKEGVALHHSADLHEALKRQQSGESARQNSHFDNYQYGTTSKSLGGLNSVVAASEAHSDNMRWDQLGTHPVGQDIQQYMGKANQNWMDAAGAWGAGAR